MDTTKIGCGFLVGAIIAALVATFCYCKYKKDTGAQNAQPSPTYIPTAMVNKEKTD